MAIEAIKVHAANMPKVQAVVVDGDNTLWKHGVAEGIGRSYLIRELKNGNLGTFFRGFKGAIEVKRTVAKLGGAEGEAEGMKLFYQVLVDNGLGTYREMSALARKHIDRNSIESVSDLVLDKLENRVPVFLSTMSGTTSALYAIRRFAEIERLEFYGTVADIRKLTGNAFETAMDIGPKMFNQFLMTGAVYNKELYEGGGELTGKLTGIEMRITSGESKLGYTMDMLEIHNFKIGDCMVIGDGDADIPMLRAAKVAVASPCANDKVKQIKGITLLRG